MDGGTVRFTLPPPASAVELRQGETKGEEGGETKGGITTGGGGGGAGRQRRLAPRSHRTVLHDDETATPSERWRSAVTLMVTPRQRPSW